MPAVRRVVRGYTPPIPGRLIAVDCETTGLNVNKGHRPFLYNFANDQGQTALIRDDQQPDWSVGQYSPLADSLCGPNRQLVRDWMKDPSIRKVFHNAKFDLRMMGKFGIEVVGPIDDTMIMAHTLSAFGIVGKDFGFREDEKDVKVAQLLSLEILAAKHLKEQKGTGPEEWLARNPSIAVTAGACRPANYSDIPAAVMDQYARQDVILTMKLFYLMNDALDKLRLRELYQTEMRLLQVVIGMEERGVRLDLPFMQSRITELHELRAASLASLQGIVRPLRVRRTKVRSRNKIKTTVRYLETVPIEQINFGSDNQMRRVLHSQFGLATQERTKTGRLKMDERNLIRLEHPFTQELVRWRQYNKLLSTYFEGYLKRANGDILHPNYMQIGTLTGRFSSQNPNLQNIPTEQVVRERAGADVIYKGVKRAFIPRDGYVNYHADFSQVEMCMMAHFARDSKIDEAVQRRDIHTEITKLLYGEISDPKEFEYKRVLAKICSFGILYGMSKKTFMWKLQVDEAKVTEILEHYFRTFPGIKRFQTETGRQIRETGQIRNIFGRRYLVDGRVAYRAVNYVCQGSAADLLKKVMVRVHQMLLDRRCKSALLLQIHDEVVLEVHESEDSWVMREVARIMVDVPECRIPLRVSVERADGNWENLHKVCMKCGHSKQPEVAHTCPVAARWGAD